MSFWSWLATTLPDWEDLIDEVMPLSVRVGGVQMYKEDVAVRAWEDPTSQEAIVSRLYIEGSALDLSMGQVDQINNVLQDQAERVQRDGSRSRGGSFGVRVVESPMVQLIIPNTYRVAIEAVSGGQAVTNVIGINAAPGQASAVASAVRTQWTASGGPTNQLMNTYGMTGVRAVDLSSPQGDIALVTSLQVGSKTTSSKSTNGACALIKWNGGTRSRSSRGRLYYGPLAEDQIDADGRSLNATARSAIAAAFTQFRTGLASAGFPLAVISPTLSQSFPVTSSAVEAIIATQRRRIRS